MPDTTPTAPSATSARSARYGSGARVHGAVRGRAPRRPGLRGAWTAALVTMSAALAACGGDAGASPASPGAPTPVASGPAPEHEESPTAEGTTPAGAPRPTASQPDATAVLAFAGDVHFEGSAAAGLGGELGSAFEVLADADAAVVNLETAITVAGDPQPKQYTFRAPPQALAALRAAGVDAVSLANNHGMDFGVSGLHDTLAAEESSGLPILGAGTDEDEAFEPWRTTLQGIDVSVLAATDVLDSSAIATWTAGPGVPGLASAKDPARLLAAVEAERERADVVVVFLHWGVERQTCPTARQQELARLLADAGVDVLVGSHAHVLQPQDMLGSTSVHFGLGNFLWYARGGPSARTGVATVTVSRDGVVDTGWHPATIVAGRPQLAEGADRRSRVEELAGLC